MQVGFEPDRGVCDRLSAGRHGTIKVPTYLAVRSLTFSPLLYLSMVLVGLLSVKRSPLGELSAGLKRWIPH